MSKYMQIDIRLIPFYERPFAKAFPKLAGILKQTSYLVPPEKEVSLYDLTDFLSRMNLDPKIPAEFKEKIRSHLSKMISLKETAREFFLSRKLNELDAILYQIEDLFDEIEGIL